MGRDKVGKRVKKGSRPKSSVKETGTLRGKFWIGDNEYMVVRYVLDNGLFRFYVKDIAEYLGIDNRRAYDVLQRLVARGWVRKIARGFYEFTADPIKIVSHYRVHSITGKIKSKVRRIAEAITKLFSQGKAHDTREPHRPVVRPVGLFFDNVRGFLRFSGRYVPGDDGFVRRPEDLVLFESISYSEIQYQVEGVEFPENAFLKIYTNYDQDGGNRVRVELAPPGGFIKRFGVEAGVRLYWELWLKAVKALLVLIGEAPYHILKRFLEWLTSSGVGKFLTDVICLA